MARFAACFALGALALTGCPSPTPAPSVEPIARAPTRSAAPTRALDAPAQPAQPTIIPPFDAHVMPSSPDAAPDVSSDASADDTFVLSGGGTFDCALSVVDGALRARCADGAMQCATVARGRISREERDDTVSICEYRDNGALYAVVATERAAVWSEHVLGASPPTCANYTASVRLLEAPNVPLRALLVSARRCDEPGRSIDADHLYRVRDGAFIEVASAQFECITAETRIAHEGRPLNYGCSGEYLVPTGAGASVSVVGHAITVRQRTLGEARLMLDRGHVQRRIRWAEPTAP